MKKISLVLGLMLAFVPFADAQQKAPVKHMQAPPIHAAKGVIASAWNPDHIKHPRGLNKTPRWKLISARRFDKTGIKFPSMVTMLPKQLDMWGNDQYGDCVSASEAARKAAYSVFCGLPETFIPTNNVINWATQYGYRDGANLTDVMTTMETNGMTASDGKVYTSGPYSSVDYTDENALKAAISLGPVNVGMDANALPSGAGNNNGWYAFGGTPGSFSNEDHCIAIFGYGKTADLATAIGQAYGVTVTLPANAPADGYIFFTWSTVGIVDHPWIMSTVGETWSQTPTTPGQTPGPTPAPPVPVPPIPPIPVPPIPPAPGSATTITTNNPLAAGTYEVSPTGTAAAIQQAQAALAAIGQGKPMEKVAAPKTPSPPAPLPSVDPLRKDFEDFRAEQRKINEKIINLLQQVLPKQKASAPSNKIDLTELFPSVQQKAGDYAVIAGLGKSEWVAVSDVSRYNFTPGEWRIHYVRGASNLGYKLVNLQ